MLDAANSRDFQDDLLGLIRPWMFGLGIPLSLLGVALSYTLSSIGVPDSLVAAIAWTLILSAPYVFIVLYLSIIRIRHSRIHVKEYFKKNSFDSWLMHASVMGYLCAAATGLIGSFIAPGIFVLF